MQLVVEVNVNLFRKRTRPRQLVPNLLHLHRRPKERNHRTGHISNLPPSTHALACCLWFISAARAACCKQPRATRQQLQLATKTPPSAHAGLQSTHCTTPARGRHPTHTATRTHAHGSRRIGGAAVRPCCRARRRGSCARRDCALGRTRDQGLVARPPAPPQRARVGRRPSAMPTHYCCQPFRGPGVLFHLQTAIALAARAESSPCFSPQKKTV